MGTTTPATGTTLHIDGAKDNTSATPTATEAANDVVVTDAGKVGIGTATPYTKLQTDGGFVVFERSASDALISLEPNYDGSSLLESLNSARDTYRSLRIVSSNLELKATEASGFVHVVGSKVGIGANNFTPTDNLHVQGSATFESTNGNVGFVSIVPDFDNKSYLQFFTGSGQFKEAYIDAGKLTISASGGQDIILLSGNVGIGATTPAKALEVVRTGSQADITATTYGVNGGGILHGRMARGTETSPLPVLAGDIIAGIGGRAYHSGNAFQDSSPASIHWVVSEDQTPTNFGSYLRVLTTPKGTINRAETAVFSDNGTLWLHDDYSGYDAKNESMTRPLAVGGGLRFVISGTPSSNSSTIGTSMAVVSYGGSDSGYRGLISGGTPDAPTAVGANILLSYLGGSGHDGTSFSASSNGLIGIYTHDTFTTTSKPTYINFSTTLSGTTTRSERMRITNDGKIGIGTNNPTEKLEVAGAIKIGNTTTASPAAGTIRFNSTTNKFEGYDGAAWVVFH